MSSSTNNSSVQSVRLDCDSVNPMSSTSSFVICRGVLLLPLSVFILYLGVQQRRQQRSVTAASHFDVFTYHQAAMQLIWGLGSMLNVLGVYLNDPVLMKVGGVSRSIIFFGETHFHILTCVERYLAVVHPVTYRGLQSSHRVRNGSIVFAWSVSLVWSWAFLFYPTPTLMVLFLGFLVLSFVVISFCSFFVLIALLRRRPGDRNRGQTDQIKLRAFFTVTAILGAVFLWFLAFLVATAIKESTALRLQASCMITYYVLWFSLPSSLVLPLLYLHKKGASL